MVVVGKAFAYTTEWNRHHPLGTADHYQVYRCFEFHRSAENRGLTLTSTEGGDFLFVEERVISPVNDPLPKRVDYKVEGMEEAETEERPHGSASHVIRKRVRKYYKKKEERTRHEVRGHWHYEAEPNLLKLVYPLEASVKGSLGGPLVKEWAVLKDGEGQAIGLKYDGNDKYHMAAVDAARPWD
eukprot:GGOE01018291.1.p1 GENE.GGOE01018291.1~~GGOE01018291.1.p1  ORF type:complete len:184 (+),score=60.40 GGOE01018291.1:95-646(+)